MLLAAALLGPAGFVSAGGCERVDVLDTINVTGAAPAGSKCDRFVGLAAREGVSCYWEFEYRDEQAIAFSDGLWAEITRCREGDQSGPDARVNHPDSYDLRELVVGTDVYHVTIKDKGSERRTLVFVRLERDSD